MTGSSIDLRPMLPPVSNQGSRNTCMAFAASGAHAAVCGKPGPSLSVEYAHYHACQRRLIFNPHEGTSIMDMFEALADSGQPHESMWPYLDALPNDLSKYYPPIVPSTLYKHAGRLLANFSEVVPQLQKGVPVLLGVRLSVNFHILNSKDILQHDPDPNPAGHHAIVAVGYEEKGSQTVFLVRNSWGTGWADAGHGRVDASYLKPRVTFMGVFCA
jgi:C1A family cysteine protease